MTRPRMGHGEAWIPQNGCSPKPSARTPSSSLDDHHDGERAWSTGNLVRPLIHGATYFPRPVRRDRGRTVRRPGPLHRLAGRRRPAADRSSRAARWSRCWAAPTSAGSTSAGWSGAPTSTRPASSPRENRHLGEQLQRRGAEVLLDMRVRTGGSHHQKFVVVRYRDDPARDVAFVGGHGPRPQPPRRRRPRG